MKRIMINADNCMGCKNCSVACMRSHGQNHNNVYALNLSDGVNESRNDILMDANHRFKPLFCRHCDEPECAKSCMSGAMAKNPGTGYVRYNADQCGACFMCVMNCPYGVIKPDRATRSIVIKCDFCENDGDDPNCVRACRGEAIYVSAVAGQEVQV